MAKVLFCVSDEEIRVQFSKQLFKQDICCLECSEYENLLEKIHNNEIQLILIQADILEIEKIDHACPNIPIVALTGEISGNEKVAYLEHGARDVVTKNSLPEELAARIKAIIRWNKARV